jgi:hypothetical protein
MLLGLAALSLPPRAMKLRDLELDVPLLSLGAGGGAVVGGDGGGVDVLDLVSPTSASSRSSFSSSDYSRTSGASGETGGTSPLVSPLSPGSVDVEVSPTSALKRQGSGKLLKRRPSVSVGGATYTSAQSEAAAPRKVTAPSALGSATYSFLRFFFHSLCDASLLPPHRLPLLPRPLKEAAVPSRPTIKSN